MHEYNIYLRRSTMLRLRKIKKLTNFSSFSSIFISLSLVIASFSFSPSTRAAGRERQRLHLKAWTPASSRSATDFPVQPSDSSLFLAIYETLEAHMHFHAFQKDTGNIFRRRIFHKFHHYIFPCARCAFLQTNQILIRRLDHHGHRFARLNILFGTDFADSGDAIDDRLQIFLCFPINPARIRHRPRELMSIPAPVGLICAHSSSVTNGQ